MQSHPHLLAVAMAIAAVVCCTAPTSAEQDAVAPSATTERARRAPAPDDKATPESAEDLPLNLREAEAANTDAPAESPGKYLLRALLSLGIVVGLIYLIFFGARLWRRARAPSHGRGAMITVLDAAKIDADKTVYVVALGAKTVVLGGSGAQLTFICELDDTEAARFRKNDERPALPDGRDA